MTLPEELWVFAYGSLLWNPEFDPAETRLAKLSGFRRSFCMWSIHHRGTPENMGLVLALDREKGADCTGVAMRLRSDEQDSIIEMLRERELVSSAYLEQVHPVQLQDERVVNAVCYVVDSEHEQYCKLTLERQAQTISKAIGGRGTNSEYLFNTAAQIEKLGIQDAELDWLVARVNALNA